MAHHCTSRRRPRVRKALGLFVIVAATYVLTDPGRIDSVDGQRRFDVSLSLLEIGRPVLRDPALRHLGVPGRDGLLYTGYGAAGSLVPLPLVWLGGLTDDPLGETRRFLFCLASPLLGAGLIALLYLFYLELDIGDRQALGWSLVAAFATLLWPASTTVLDQIQHAFFAFLALYLAYLAGQRSSAVLATCGGLVAAVLFNYQESYALVLPVLGLAAVAKSDGSRGSTPFGRYLVFLAAAGLGVAGWMSFNLTRFGNPFMTGKSLPGARPALFGNPVAGAVSLLVSPGKGIVFYSPTIVLGVLGIAALRRRQPLLATIVAVASLLHFGLVSSLSFFSGDWCWGPRYLVVLLPLWALAFPFVAPSLRRRLVPALVILGLGVQLLGLSLPHERFFFEHNLLTQFWVQDPWVYFKRSALAARPGEIWSSLRHGVPAAASGFSPSPYQGLLTYSVSASRREEPALWMRHFKVFYLGRPWPLWLPFVDSSRHDLPVPLLPAVAVCGVLGGLGLALLRRRRASEQRRAHGPPE